MSAYLIKIKIKKENNPKGETKQALRLFEMTNDDQGKDVVPTKQTEERKLTRHGNKNKMQGHLLCILTSVWALRTPNAG